MTTRDWHGDRLGDGEESLTANVCAETDARPLLAPKAMLRWDPRHRCHILLYPERGLVLNESALAVIRLCDGARTVDEIIAALATQFGSAEIIAEDVRVVLDDLHGRGLLLGYAPVPTQPTGVAIPRRYEGTRSPAAEREMRAEVEVYRPYTLIAEVTYRCPLRCVYCSNPVDVASRRAELSTEAWLRVVRDAAALGVLQLHLTGGEPLLRSDLEALAAAGRAAGMFTNLITSGIPLQRNRLRDLRAAGIDNVQLSFQDVESAGARTIAGIDALAPKLEVAAWVKAEGLPLTVNVVLHRGNLDRIEQLVALAERLGADRLELANTQYHGFALSNRTRLLPRRAQLDHAFRVASEARVRLRGRMEVVYVRPDYFPGLPGPAWTDGPAATFTWCRMGPYFRAMLPNPSRR